MTNTEAIETLRANYPDACYEQLREAVDSAIEVLKAQGVAGDLISRQAAIDALKRISFSHRFEYGEYLSEDTREIEIINSNKALEAIEALPSVQPEKHTDKRTETHASDLISRAEAIDRAVSIPMFGRDVKMVAVSEIKNLPSVQPEIVMCVDCQKYIDYRCRDEHANINDFRHEDDYCSFAECRDD